MKLLKRSLRKTKNLVAINWINSYTIWIVRWSNYQTTVTIQAAIKTSTLFLIIRAIYAIPKILPLAENIHDYFLREVKPHVEEAWIDWTKPKLGMKLALINISISTSH